MVNVIIKRKNYSYINSTTNLPFFLNKKGHNLENHVLFKPGTNLNEP